MTFQEKTVTNLEFELTDHVGVGKADWQCESGDIITINPKAAVLIKSCLPFVAKLARYLEHRGTWRWSLIEKHSVVKSAVPWVPVIDVFVLAVQNIRPDLITQLAWKV